MIIAGVIAAVGAITILASPTAVTALLGVILTGSIVLHSYAALQLHKSLADPNLPLDSKTPTGIRFIGFIALFFAIMNIFSGFAIIGNTTEIIDQLQLPAEVQEMVTPTMLKAVAAFILLFSFSVAVNVNLNFALLRNYTNKKEKENHD